MRNILFVLLAGFALAACGLDETDGRPELATIATEYSLADITIDGNDQLLTVTNGQEGCFEFYNSLTQELGFSVTLSSPSTNYSLSASLKKAPNYSLVPITSSHVSPSSFGSPATFRTQSYINSGTYRFCIHNPSALYVTAGLRIRTPRYGNLNVVPPGTTNTDTIDLYRSEFGRYSFTATNSYTWLAPGLHSTSPSGKDIKLTVTTASGTTVASCSMNQNINTNCPCRFSSTPNAQYSLLIETTEASSASIPLRVTNYNSISPCRATF